MVDVVQTVRKLYQAEIWALDHLKHFFLLILRLYFGWGFMSAGLGKLENVETHTGFFRDWGIPLPLLNVYLAGTTETVCALGGGIPHHHDPVIGHDVRRLPDGPQRAACRALG
jgi:hypothetical protein